MRKGSGIVNFELDESLVLPIVEKEIETAVVRQLEKLPDLLPRLVRQVLKQKVNAEGEVGRYDNKYDFIEIAFEKAIKTEIRSAIMAYISENRASIKEEVARQIKELRSPMAEAFVSGLCNSLESQWSFKLEIKTPYS